jgi:hypothetical protein
MKRAAELRLPGAKSGIKLTREVRFAFTSGYLLR